MRGALLLAMALVLAPNLAAAATSDFVIGYLQVKGDSRYGRKRAYARYLTHPLGRPYAGAKVALKEVKFHGSGAGVTFKLRRIKGENADALASQIEALRAQGVHFFVADLPASTLQQVAASAAGRSVVLFNVSAREDRLREEDCAANVFHVIPSYAMLSDALGQYLVSRKWRDVLMLVGPSPADELYAQAFLRSAKRFGANVVAQRRFVLSNDPRQRDQSNVSLLTSEVDYDVVFVADTDGEFARNVPYSTLRPRPVVGSEGLAAAAWHWAWERHGAPQLEKRFEKSAKRPMRSFDWAAWLAVKTVADVVQQTASTDADLLIQRLRSQDLILDAFKGNRANFRSWNNQLRQPLLLITHNWVVERAPIKGFLHHKHDLDSLGVDEAESRCRF